MIYCRVMVIMTKRKTSISIDESLWTEWNMYVIRKRGSARKLSEEIENALRDYMQNNPYHKNNKT